MIRPIGVLSTYTNDQDDIWRTESNLVDGHNLNGMVNSIAWISMLR